MTNYSPRLYMATAMLLLLGACDQASSQEGGMQMPPPAVTVTTLSAQDVPLTPSYPARTHGSREVEVRARVGGILLKRAYEEGQFIERGSILFEIDPDQYQVAYDRARAQLQQAQARAKAAERNWNRVDPLYKEQAVSARARDEALSELETAKAAVAAANAEVKAAKLNLDYTKVEAPISGIASKETVSEGSLVGVGAGDSLLTHMTQLDPIYVNFAYPEADYMTQRRLIENANGGTMQEAAPLQATLTLGNGAEYGQAGTVSFTDAIVDPQTGSVQARAVFPNPDGTLMPGQFVRITLQGVTLPRAIVVPQAAVLQGPQGKFVYRIGADDTAQIAPIETGVAQGNDWVVEKGLSAGDTIIIDGIIKVQPGGAVNAQPAVAGGAAAASAPAQPPAQQAAPDAPPAAPPQAPADTDNQAGSAE